MADKITTRITIDYPDEKRQLLTIVQKSSGDLVVIPREGDKYFDSLTEDVDISERRYSIHVSPRSPDENLFKQTVMLSDGNSRQTYIQTKAIPLGRYQMVYTSLLQDMSTSRYDVRLKSGDRSENLCSVPSNRSLIICVIVSSPTSAHLESTSSYKIQEFSFDEFRVSVAYTFAYVPAPPRGYSFSLLSSAPIINGEADSSSLKQPLNGASLADSEAAINGSLALMHEKAIMMVSSHLIKGGMSAFELKSFVAALRTIGHGLLSDTDFNTALSSALSM